MNVKKGLLAIITVAVFALSATAANAQWDGHGHPHATQIVILDWPGYYTWPAGTAFQQQIVNTTQTHWYQQQAPTIVPRTTYRLETTPAKSYVYVEQQVEEVQRQVTYVPVARTVEQELTTTVLIPFIVTGPLGQPIVACKPESKTHKVSRIVHDMQPVVKEYKVKTTKQVPQERITQYQQIVPVTTYDEVLTLQWQQTQMPAQHLVTVPVYLPHHPPANFWP
jgi:hypothetical protein